VSLGSRGGEDADAVVLGQSLVLPGTTQGRRGLARHLQHSGLLFSRRDKAKPSVTPVRRPAKQAVIPRGCQPETVRVMRVRRPWSGARLRGRRTTSTTPARN